MIMDLSVPRNVEAPEACPDHIRIYDVDDLSAVAESNRELRNGEIEKSEDIVRAQRDEFLSWLSSLQLTPTIHKLKEKTKSLYEDELASLEHKLSAGEYEKVEEFARYLEGRWLGLLVRNLREMTGQGRNLGYIDMIHRLFELEKPEPREETDGDEGR